MWKRNLLKLQIPGSLFWCLMIWIFSGAWTLVFGCSDRRRLPGSGGSQINPHANQKQAHTGQKMKSPVDLGCEAMLCRFLAMRRQPFRIAFAVKSA
jgi:hypothetical protein